MGERYRTMLEQGIDPVNQAQMDRKASGFTDVSQSHLVLSLCSSHLSRSSPYARLPPDYISMSCALVEVQQRNIWRSVC